MLNGVVKSGLGVQELAVVKSWGVWGVRFEGDVVHDGGTCAGGAEGSGIKVRLDEKEGQVGVVVGGNVGDDGCNRCTAFEGRSLVVVEGSKKSGQRGIGLTSNNFADLARAGRWCHHTPRVGVILGANRLPQRRKNVEDVVDPANRINGTANKLRGAGSVERCNLGAYNTV